MTPCEHLEQASEIIDDRWHVRCLNPDCQAYWTEALRNKDYIAEKLREALPGIPVYTDAPTSPDAREEP